MTPLAAPNRRDAMDQRQAQVAELLAAWGCEQLLLMDRGNLHWFCGEPIARGIVDPEEQPALIISPVHRFVVCCNHDAQRLFDTYLDNLGFQLKVWPWHLGRERLLAELTANKKLASDRLIEGAEYVANQLRDIRLTLDEPARLRLAALGADLAHALEASARNLSRGSTEREAAGHLGHRLLHRGIEPVVLHIAADGRLARDPRPGFTSVPIHDSCALFALGQRDGLHVAATRTFHFADWNEEQQRDQVLSLQMAAARAAVMKPSTPIAEVFQAGQRIAASHDREFAWREHAIGHYLGWLPVEQPLLPDAVTLLQPHQAQFWQVQIGSAWSGDTVLQSPDGPVWITGPEEWPTRRFQIGETFISLPDALPR